MQPIEQMEREIKKRGREAVEVKEERERVAEFSKKGKKKKNDIITDVFLEDTDIFKISSDTFRPLGVFEFPWQKDDDRPVIESDVCDLRDVFFSSLVDGCKAAIGFPGDRLSPSPAPIALPDGSWASDHEIDGVDCIWSCMLREPFSAVYSKGSIG